MFVACWLAFGACCLLCVLSADCCLLCVGWCSVWAVCGWLYAVRWFLLFAVLCVCCSLRVVFLYVDGCLLRDDCCLLRVVACSLLGGC